MSISNLLFWTYYPQGKGIAMHKDGQRQNEKYKLLIYLSDVESGGETIFMKIRFIAQNRNRAKLFYFILIYNTVQISLKKEKNMRWDLKKLGGKNDLSS